MDWTDILQESVSVEIRPINWFSVEIRLINRFSVEIRLLVFHVGVCFFQGFCFPLSFVCLICNVFSGFPFSCFCFFGLCLLAAAAAFRMQVSISIMIKCKT